VFCWVRDTLGGWVGSSSCPTPALPSGISGHPIEVNTCIAEPALAILRPLLLILTTVGLAWFFAATAMGISPQKDDD